jgi:hypothetical protein
MLRRKNRRRIVKITVWKMRINLTEKDLVRARMMTKR